MIVLNRRTRPRTMQADVLIKTRRALPANRCAQYYVISLLIVVENVVCFARCRREYRFTVRRRRHTENVQHYVIYYYF
jgi:hypothetical protein